MMRRRSILVSALAAAFLLAGLGSALFVRHQHRKHSFVTDGGDLRVPLDEAAMRDVHWRMPRSLGGDIDTNSPEYEPRLSADGLTLYFVRGKAGGAADIWTATRRDPNSEEWTDARPIAAIDAPDSDELGAEPSRDGTRLYFSSNRAGGSGGYDLWMSRRGPDGWEAPANLGLGINTPFDEYGPAVSPDGATLCFASNRPRPGEAVIPESTTWSATLRENRLRHDFDLYAAPLGPNGDGTRISNDGQATPESTTAALAALNTSSDEGSPAFSPAGDFLYFASNRAGGQGGFDLFRSRLLRGEWLPPENLGPQVNSPVNDLDPALDAGGFALHFSSDRDAAADARDNYDLFSTRTREVFIDRDRNAALIDWAMLWAIIAPAIPWLILALLLVLLCRALIRSIRSGRLSLLARCLLASLLVHAALMFLFTFWQVTATLAEGVSRTRGGTKIAIGSPQGGDSLTTQIRGGLTDVSFTAATPAIARADARPRDFDAAASLQAPNIPRASDGATLVRLSIEATDAAAASTSERNERPQMSPLDLSASLDAAIVRTPSGRTPAVIAEPKAPLPEGRAPSVARAADVASADVASNESPGSSSASPHPPAAPASAAIEPMKGMAVSPHAEPTDAPADRPPRSGDRDSTPAQALDLAQSGGATAHDLPLPRESAAEQAGGEPVLALAQESPFSERGNAAGAAAPSIDDRIDAIGPRAVGGRSIDVASSPAIPPGMAQRETVKDAVAAASTDDAVLDSSHASDLSGSPRGDASLKLPSAPPAHAAAEAATRPESMSPTPLGAIDAASPPAAMRSETPIGANQAVAPDFKPGLNSPSPGRDIAGALPDHTAVTANEADVPHGAIAHTGLSESLPRVMTLPLSAAASSGLEKGLRLPVETGPAIDPYALRSDQTRLEVAKRMGGGEATEAAVNRALKWLSAHQATDGRWAARGFDEECKACGGAGKYDADVATTALALLCFFAADHTHQKEGVYRQQVARGLEWLKSQQGPGGDMRGRETMYSHGIATIALAEAYGMTHDEALREPVERAVRFILQARNTDVGGWRYEPGQVGDTSVMGWQIMALTSARRAGLAVPDEALDAAKRWLELVGSAAKPGLYAYQPGQRPSPSMTAEGMFVQQLLGVPHDDPRMLRSSEYIAENLPMWSREPNTYYWYYATLALYQQQGETWKTWNAALTKQLLDNQRRSGPAEGSWDPVDGWSRIGGRVYQTAICTLSLEVYYRYLPMYAATPAANIAP